MRGYFQAGWRRNAGGCFVIGFGLFFLVAPGFTVLLGWGIAVLACLPSERFGGLWWGFGFRLGRCFGGLLMFLVFVGPSSSYGKCRRGGFLGLVFFFWVVYIGDFGILFSYA